MKQHSNDTHQHPKDSFDNLTQEEAIAKMKDIAEGCRNCMLVTDLHQVPSASRPMYLQEVCDQGNFWFISSAKSDKNAAIAADNRVQLYFQDNGSAEYLSVFGEASIHTDKATIDKYWTSFAEAWFTGKDDPNVTILKVKPLDAYYWETKSGKFIAFMKRAISAATGAKMDDDGVEGSLEV